MWRPLQPNNPSGLYRKMRFIGPGITAMSSEQWQQAYMRLQSYFACASVFMARQELR
nr:hypothetical protein L204_04809 [Cryptococcus depauperatus CBS 7855]